MIPKLIILALWACCCWGLPLQADEAFAGSEVTSLETKNASAHPAAFESHLDWVRVLPAQGEEKSSVAKDSTREKTPSPTYHLEKIHSQLSTVKAKAPAKIAAASDRVPARKTKLASTPAKVISTTTTVTTTITTKVSAATAAAKLAAARDRLTSTADKIASAASTSKRQITASMTQTLVSARNEIVARKNGLVSRLARLTAYWAGEDYYTDRRVSATGIHLHGGHCAVDPTIIPYGSVVEIPGVGQFLAVDTGSAVISRTAAREAGHTRAERGALVIDLFFEHRSEGERFAASGAKFVSISWWTPEATGFYARQARHLFADEDWNKIYSKQL